MQAGMNGFFDEFDSFEQVDIEEEDCPELGEMLAENAAIWGATNFDVPTEGLIGS